MSNNPMSGFLTIPVRRCSVEVRPEFDEYAQPTGAVKPVLVLEPDQNGRRIELDYNDAMTFLKLAPAASRDQGYLTGGTLNHELETTDRQLVLYVGVSRGAKGKMLLGIQPKAAGTQHLPPTWVNLT